MKEFHPLDFIWTHDPTNKTTYQDLAIQTALHAECHKSKRGVVIKGINTYWANNGPPQGFICTGNERCRLHCSKVAVHAEERAILKAGLFTRGAEMIHIKVVDEEAVPSLLPSCWQCSRMIVESGISGMWLFHSEGWFRYTAEEFHRETLRNCNML